MLNLIPDTGLNREARGMFSANQNAPGISGGGGGRAGSHPDQGLNYI